jgi:hypothetical protein
MPGLTKLRQAQQEMEKPRLACFPGPAVLLLVALFGLLFPERTSAQGVPPAPGQLPWSPASANFAPVPSGVGGFPSGAARQEKKSTTLAEEQLLLSLLEQERVLLIDFGPDHFQVQNVRARISVVLDYLAQKKAQEAAKPQPMANSVPTNSLFASESPLKPMQQMPTSVPTFAGPRIASVKPWLASKIMQTAFLERSTSADKMSASQGGIPEPVQVTAGVPSAPASLPDKAASGSAAKHAIDADERLAKEAALVWPQPLVLVLTIVVGLMLGLMIHFVTVLWLIRCFGSKLASLLHIEVTHHSPSPVNPLQEIRVPSVPAVDAHSADGAAPDHAPQLFDIGPTFEEERLTKLQEAERREGAVLMELFQQNLHLREQMDQLEVEIT